ncbi:MAG TPA: hypothetical protein VKS78_15410 [Roseiarcus sp.]|nr:hypothetical protein [Roseiarcus sp.]
MPRTLSELRERIHKKLDTYFTFSYGRREEASLRLLYGATDALLDASMAASAFGSAISSRTATNLLACYGFLQAVYIQQDAVEVLSRAIGLSWRPQDDPVLSKIRDLRNRLTGHPALAGELLRPPKLSSAIIPYNGIRCDGFDGHIYYDGSFETVHVDVASILQTNEERLVAQTEAIEIEMDRRESDFRSAQAGAQFYDTLGTNFGYLVHRLYCDLNDEDRLRQSLAHLEMIRDRVLELQKKLADRGFSAEVAANDVILEGLKMIGEILQGDRTSASQRQFILMYGGLEKELKAFTSSISELDARLAAPVK